MVALGFPMKPMKYRKHGTTPLDGPTNLATTVNFVVYAFSTNALKASDPNHSPNSGESNDGTPPAEAEDDDAGAAAFSGAFLLIALFILNNMNRPPYPPIIAIATEYEEREFRDDE